MATVGSLVWGERLSILQQQHFGVFLLLINFLVWLYFYRYVGVCCKMRIWFLWGIRIPVSEIHFRSRVKSRFSRIPLFGSRSSTILPRNKGEGGGGGEGDDVERKRNVSFVQDLLSAAPMYVCVCVSSISVAIL